MTQWLRICLPMQGTCKTNKQNILVPSPVVGTDTHQLILPHFALTGILNAAFSLPWLIANWSSERCNNLPKSQNQKTVVFLSSNCFGRGSKFLVFCFFLKIHLFIYLFMAALGLCCCVRAFSSCGERGATLCCGAQASHCGGFSYCGARALGAQASVVVTCGLSSCGSRVQAQ